MQTLSEIKSLLHERGLRPRHRFGQNFLHDHHHLRRLVEAAEVREGDLVLEVGPGTGTLTEALLERGAEVVAAEIDRDLADLMESRFGSRVHLVRGDCLGRARHLSDALIEVLAGRPFRLIANLPYQVASPLMTELLMHHACCVGQFVTIQREVADRLLASPGVKAWGPLSIIVQDLADVELLSTVPATCFWPAPKVTSAMVAIRPNQEPRVDIDGFASFVTKLFTTRRKQLGGVLGREVVDEVGVDPASRCESLDVQTLHRLHDAVRSSD
ncbi:MAG: 16S rRNA (adenine(1518)-N(6)/adenine(1519)-N(6))-dimethyltransferase RsmA [Phycisphaerales bacterium]|nr:16S rRNA (adenine(1518)-N(6)/adenine(1519)-N(6))-dimethyltransferase RsmA [Phycisphaerales bacterium]